LRKRVIRILKFLAFLAIGIGLLWLAFRNVKFKDLADELKNADYFWIILSVLFGLLAYISRARRWILLIHPLGYKPAMWHTFHALMTGYLANLALPRIGEITRCIALNRKEKIPVDQLVGTVVVERTIDFISLLIIMVVVFFTSSSQINMFLRESILVPLRDKVLALSGFTRVIWIISILILVVLLFLLIRYRKDLRKIRFFSKIFDLARGVINGLKSIAGLERKWEFILHTLFIWMNYALMTWVVAFALESTSQLSLHNAIFILVIGGLAMSAPVQSGIGIFHWTVTRGIALVEGVTLEEGLSYAIFTHESQLIFILVIGAISFYIMFGLHHRKELA
jgi:uncharacterized protein (TIRG00374 family)